MGKAKIALLTALIFGLIGLAPQARAASLIDPGVPHTINLQSVVYDAEGKVTTSESVDMTIRIVDADNNVLFSEAQNGVVVVKGAINVNIGEASGGVPLDILDPSTGIKLIDIEIAGQSPFELMPLGALPYAMWAEKSLTVANDSIGSEQIKNGSIKAEDIDPLAFSDIAGTLGDAQLPASAATVGQLNAHISSTTAHPASAIVVSGSFVTFVATNVQEALQKLDAKLVDEIVNRQATSTAFAAHVIATTAHGSDGAIVGLNTLNAGLTTKVSKAGDTMTGNLTMSGADIVMDAGRTVDGVDVSALQASVTTITTDVSNKVSKTGDTMTGDLNMDSDANCTATVGHPCQVDGVDVSEVNNSLPPIGTIIAFYDFGGALSYDTNHWAPCDGRTVSIAGVGTVTLPDLSGRYLVGFGTDGGGNMNSAPWDTTVVGNANHQINLAHSHGGRTNQMTTTAGPNEVSTDYRVKDDGSGWGNKVAMDRHFSVDTGGNDEGQHDHNIQSDLSSTQSIQPSSIRVRYLMRIK